MAKEAESREYVMAVGMDGSASSWKAFSESLAQAKQKQAVLHLVSIQESPEPSYNASEALAVEKTARENLEQIQIKARMHAETAGVKIITAIVSGHSAPALVEYVKKNGVDLLIVGDTGHSSIWGALLGTTAEKIVRDAPCSVLIVR